MDKILRFTYAIGGGVVCLFVGSVLAWVAHAWMGYAVWWWLVVLWAGVALFAVTGVWFFLQLRTDSWLRG